MRDFKGMKRQRGRNRGGGKPQNNANRAFDSNGPENVKVRGTAQHVYEKYQALARDAQTAGDRVLAENFLQHADHYFRVLRLMQPQRPIADIIGREQATQGFDIDFEEEPEVIEARAEASEGAEGESRGDYQREERREFRPREERREGFDRNREFRDRRDRRDDRPPRQDRREDPLPLAAAPTPGYEPSPFHAPEAPAEEVVAAEDHLPAFLRAPQGEEGEPRRRRRRTPRSFETAEAPSDVE